MATKPKAFIRKAPAQARAQATVEAILQAVAHILTRQGYDALTTNLVAQRAGVSIGSLYQYFPNKDALLMALAKKHVDDIEATIDDALAKMPRTLSLAELVRSLIEANIAAHLIDPALHSALSERLPYQGDQDWRIAFDQRVSAKVAAILHAHRGALAVTNIDLATYIIVRSVEACVHDAYRWRKADLKNGALADEVTRLVLSYLMGASGRR
jgi:AcrR family transcriptional regulator